MSADCGTREKLLTILNDIEVVVMSILNHLALPKNLRDPEINLSELIELSVVKHQELKTLLKTAEEQAEIQKEIDELQSKIYKADEDISQLMKRLKDAEQILDNVIYEAKQKMVSIETTDKKSVPVDELMKYAHLVGSSNSVVSPCNWKPGDFRRPYPTDIEMRLGFLGHPSEIDDAKKEKNLNELPSSHDDSSKMEISEVDSHIEPQIHVSTNDSIPTKTQKEDSAELREVSTGSSSNASIVLD